MSKLLANQIANYADNGPVEAKEGINFPSGKPLQVAGVAGTAGQYLKTTGSTIAWTDFPTIPAAQVNSDWNATSGVAQILNKPTLATVATSGSYSDLSGLPTIPAAQVQVNWNQANTSAVDFIQNKPTLFSGSYNDLTNKPTIPNNLGDLANVASTAPANNDVLSWNGSNWAPSATGAGGSTTFIGLTDTPASLTASKWLRVNAGATALEYVNAPYDTSYSQSAVASGSNVNLRLTSSQAANDDILITAGSNITFANVTAAGFTISSNPDTDTTYTHGSVSSGNNVNLRLSGSNGNDDDILLTAGSGISFSAVTANGFTITSSGATVTTDDSAPGSPSDGDLWWKSDEGRLKVYYQDADSSQWVDASPLQAPTSVISGSNSLTFGTVNLGSNVNNCMILEPTGTIVMKSHLLPALHEQYDIGSADRKIRHMFVSDNSIYMGDEGATIKSEGTAIVVQDLKTGDLHLDNTQKTFMGHQVGNDIDGTSGSWTFQEGSNDLYLLNNTSGKRYKINLTEV